MELTCRLRVGTRVGRKPDAFVSMLIGTAALLLAPGACADPVAVINAPRTEGCAGRPAAAAVQRHQAALPANPPAVAQRVLELVNAARAEARRCGRDEFAAAPPLALSALLSEVALLHSCDIAQRRSLGHQGSDGSTAGERLTRSGYLWRAFGENVAAGQRDAEAVVAAWLDSPEHCTSIMGPQFTEMGVAFALAPSSYPAIYWTQVFAAPR